MTLSCPKVKFGQLNFNYNVLVAAPTNIGLCDINNLGTKDQTRRNSTKTFFWVGGGEYRPSRVSALVKTAH